MTDFFYQNLKILLIYTFFFW